jgi:hypothetical protein
MENREELSKRFTTQWMSDLINGGNPASNRMAWTILAMLSFVGEEAVQIVFRKNFGIGGLSVLRIVVCFLLFELVAVLCFFLGTHPMESRAVIGSSASFTWAGMFYVVLGFIVLIKGFMGMAKAKKSNRFDKFTGESAILSFLGKDGWSQSRIQNVAEPVLTLAVGVALSFVNILWGVVIIYCGISVWACKVMDAIFLEPSDPQPTSQQQQGRNFHDVK